MPDMFVTMYRAQTNLQRDTYLGGKHPTELDDAAKMEYLRTNFLALFNELNEAMDETGWKPWATSNHINYESYRSELVDAFHFFLNLLFTAGITPHEFFNKFMEKNDRNRQRQKEGYDGVAGKCAGCHRSFDDSGVLCTKENLDASMGLVTPTYCDKTKTYDDLSGFKMRLRNRLVLGPVLTTRATEHPVIVSPMDKGADPASVA